MRCYLRRRARTQGGASGGTPKPPNLHEMLTEITGKLTAVGLGRSYEGQHQYFQSGADLTPP